MSRIHVLPPDIVSQIAAGEVIERPASCVKELLENSLDAGATSIELHIKDAGRSLIRVRDNGGGIDPGDMEMLFLRHSTSKISTAQDLYNIGTLGFRGEALYSIASIADITVRSKTPADESGWEIHCRGGKQRARKPVGFVNGTEIEITELFFNTPARKKFLKSDTTELNQILGVFVPYTLLYPGYSFLLVHNGKKLIDLKAHDDPAGRYADALRVNEGNLLSVKQAYGGKQLSVSMILGDINIQRPRKDLQFIFVNNRPVHNRAIAFHINEAYKLIMPEHTAPAFAISVTIPAHDIDVNVHPTKREVKIKDEQSIASWCRYVCEQALMKTSQARQAGTQIFTFQPRESSAQAPAVRETPKEHYQASAIPETLLYTHELNVLPAQVTSLRDRLSAAVYIGNYRKKYVLFDGNDALLVIDQHAAHERVTFEKFKKQIETGTIESQQLLSPVLVRLTHQEMNSWYQTHEKIGALGFQTTQWDPESIAIHSFPQLIPEAETAVRNLISGENINRCDTDTIARRACRQSVMTGDMVHKNEAEYLRRELLACADPFTCPHGRPTVIEINEKMLSKQFLR